jgi:hypothetical protein
MAIREGDEQKLADKKTRDDAERVRNLPPPQSRKESEVMKRVRDTDIEGDN